VHWTTNKNQIMNNLISFSKGKTVVVDRTRLSTVKNADQIIVLEKGKIVELEIIPTLLLWRGQLLRISEKF